jgi:hypothetical protein
VRPIALQAAAIAMMQAVQLGLLHKARSEGRAPSSHEGVAAGLLAVLRADPVNKFDAVIDGMTQEQKDRLVQIMSIAVLELTYLHVQFKRDMEIQDIGSRMTPEAIAIAENHQCEKCPAYDECDLPAVSEGGPRKELKPGEWNPVPISGMTRGHPEAETAAAIMRFAAPTTKQ